MDLRRLFPADSRYGPMQFSQYDEDLVQCGGLTGNTMMYAYSDPDGVNIQWWVYREEGSIP
jgi:hypothetical protein